MLLIQLSPRTRGGLGGQGTHHPTQEAGLSAAGGCTPHTPPMSWTCPYFWGAKQYRRQGACPAWVSSIHSCSRTSGFSYTVRSTWPSLQARWPATSPSMSHRSRVMAVTPKWGWEEGLGKKGGQGRAVGLPRWEETPQN